MDKVEVPRALHEILTNEENRKRIAERLELLILANFIDDLSSEDREEICNWLDYDDVGAKGLLAETKPKKEPLYYVKFTTDSGYDYLNLSTRKNCLFTSSKEECVGIKTNFTEQEIKHINERYWAFAVPVNEIDI